jgi:ankyrin repeat protein
MGNSTGLFNAVTQGDLIQVRAILDESPHRLHEKDQAGATALHYATLGGHREIVELLLDRGAEINKPDSQFGATPTGWAIEYLRERGGYLAIELSDLAYAIEHRDIRWVDRFLQRFPALRQGRDVNGKPFRQLADESGSAEIAAMFRGY